MAGPARPGKRKISGKANGKSDKAQADDAVALRREPMSLWSDFLTNDARQIHKWAHFFPSYEAHFGKLVNQSIVFLEIGCGAGGSLQMWKRYFGPHARIVGIDIRPECSAFEEAQIEVRIGDQGDPAFLAAVAEEFGPFDAILDDGSHVMEHIATSFRTLYPQMTRNGVYMVEDLHTAYWSEFGGGLREPGSFIELCKGLIDELNADYTGGALEPTAFTRETISMHFYDSMAVFQKGRYLRKYPLMIPEKE
jgi:SAM-dependent methyltransferase